MNTTVIEAGMSPRFTALSALTRSAQAWFAVATLGQFIFVIYIVAFYWVSAVKGDYQSWDAVLPHGIVEGDVLGNIALVAHVLLAAVITLCGPLQLIPRIRSRFPSFHRWSGRLYMLSALILSVGGIYMVWTRGVLGNMVQHWAITLNGILIIVFGLMALYYAVSRDFARHRRWVLRLFVVVSGVWFFRIGLMFWLTVNQGPVGIDFESFTGPFLYFLAFASYLLPLAILELYLHAQSSRSKALRWVSSGVLVSATLATAIGIFAASMGMWLPRI